MAEALPVPAEVRETLVRLVERHVPGHPLESVFALPGAGARPKYLARLAAMTERPLLLSIYAPDEADRLECSVIAARTLAVKRSAPSYHVVATDWKKETAPFCYRLATFLWGTDAERLLASGALPPEEVASIGEAIGDGLALMHCVEGEGFGPVNAAPAERYGDLAEAIFAATTEQAVVARVIETRDALEEAGGASRLIHGDLTLASAIVRKERVREHARVGGDPSPEGSGGGRYELAGFVGLGSAHWFDPVYDLVALEEAFLRYPLLREPCLRAYAERRPIFAELEAKRPLFRALLRVARPTASNL